MVTHKVIPMRLIMIHYIPFSDDLVPNVLANLIVNDPILNQAATNQDEPQVIPNDVAAAGNPAAAINEDANMNDA